MKSLWGVPECWCLRGCVAIALALGCSDAKNGARLEATPSKDAGAEAERTETEAATDATPDRDAMPDREDPSRLLAGSRSAWEALLQTNGSDYWLEEENCPLNSMEATRTLVQVSAGQASLVNTRRIARAECSGEMFRYRDFVPVGFPELYDQCETLLARRGERAFDLAVDARNAIRTCRLGREPGCSDACDEGFHISSWDFGTAPDN
jgi:hypothetical protein